MRNKKYTLEKELPKKIKLQVYKEALELYKNDENTIKQLGYGLCLVLPCVLWELNHFLNSAPNGEGWKFKDTCIAFPEIDKYIEEISDISIYDNTIEKMQKRIEVLKEIIQNLTNEK
jgi:hypothetical protein